MSDLMKAASMAVCFERNGKHSDCIKGCTKDTGCLVDASSDVEGDYAKAAILAAADWLQEQDIEEWNQAAMEMREAVLGGTVCQSKEQHTPETTTKGEQQD